MPMSAPPSFALSSSISSLGRAGEKFGAEFCVGGARMRARQEREFGVSAAKTKQLKRADAQPRPKFTLISAD